MISDLNGSLWSRQFLNIANKRICFASCTCAFKSSGLITCLECRISLRWLTYIVNAVDKLLNYTRLANHNPQH